MFLSAILFSTRARSVRELLLRGTQVLRRAQVYRHAPHVPAARAADGVARDGRQGRHLLGAGRLLHHALHRELRRAGAAAGQGVEVVSRVWPRLVAF